MLSVLEDLKSSHIIKGDERHAYRDPAVLYKDGVFYIYFTLVETEADGTVYMYTAETRTADLANFTPIKKLTVRDRRYNFSSPGNIVFHDGKYKMCLQTYCRENGEKFGNDNSRIFIMESADLESWDTPYPILAKGATPLSELGRMIDPYLIYEEKADVWHLFYKQNGVSHSTSHDLKSFNYEGFIDGGENVSVIEADGGYYMFHSPKNGIGVKFSSDLRNWRDVGEPLVFGQKNWTWAMGRLTAGAIVELSENERPLYLMFFHGTGPEDEEVIFDTHAGIGVAWSFDLKNWIWK